MNKKALQTSILGLGLLFLTPLSSHAQGTYYYSQDTETIETTPATSTKEDVTSENGKKYYNAYKTTWMKNRFKDTWFITLGSGVQTIMATDGDKAPFSSRLTYAPSFTIGKYFSPIWGLRVNFTGGSLHGFNDGVNGNYRKWNNGDKHYMGKGYAENLPYYGDKPIQPGKGFDSWDPSWNRRGFVLNHPDADKRICLNEKDGTYFWYPGLFPESVEKGKNYYMQHFKYVAANLNFMFDFLTLVGNYNPKRPFEITPYAGVSYAHMFPSEGQTAYDTFGVNGGLNFRFRLSKKFDFNVEGGVTLYPDEFDGRVGGRTMDVVTQGIAGITYHIGKSTWDVAEPVNYQQVQTLTRTINDLRQEVKAAKEATQNCPECLPCPEPTVIIQEQSETNQTIFLPDPVFFRIDKSVIDNGEWSKIEKAADYLRNNPSANVVVTGYADKDTGYPAYNLRLSERRAKTVSKALVDKYNINPLRISINWEGSKIQPFEINNWNRVVIFVIEK